MRDILKLAIRLFIFSCVAAVALAVTNEVTKGPIAEQKIAAQKAALEKVLPGCSYEEVENIEGLSEESVIAQLFTGKDEAGEIKGYALVANPQGYGGPIPITLGVSAEGWVTQTYVGALQETAGLGSKVGEAPFMEQFIAIPADPDTLNDHVDTIGGATVSSSAFRNAVAEMLTYTKNQLGVAPQAGDKEAILAASAGSEEAPAEETVAEASANTYDVTGFAPMKVAIEVDGEGKIASVSVTEHGETPGFGADLIADTAVFDALVGQDIATAQIDVKAGVTLTSNAINEALKMAGAPAEGGAKTYEVTGFQPMKVAIEVDGEGKIASVSVTEHGETPGFGADLIADTAVFDALVGQDIATAQIDVRSGVTLTSNAINDALKQAAADGSADGAAVIPGDPYTVKGFAKFILYIEVADGKIVSVSAPEHGETPGFGADLLTEEALSALAGQDLATAGIDVKAGVTLTSTAINNAIAQAAAANGIEVVKEEPVEAAPAVEEPVEEAAPAAEEAAPVEVPFYEATGFQPMKVAIEVNGEGKIASVSVTEHGETPGFGADLIADTAVFDALVGQDIATAQIDVKAGVTLTSNAINDALKQAAAATPATLPETSEEAAVSTVTTCEVTGFQPMKVDVEVGADGKIVSIVVTEHGETPGFGADLIADTAVFDALVGQDIATAQIDVKAGVTLTSNAINDALKQAAAATPATLPETSEEAAVSTVTTCEVTGFQPMKVDVEVGADGKIVSVVVTEHGETPGFGADLVADTAVFDALVGQDIATAQIDVKSGVTLTSNAINNALKQAAEEVQ